MCYLRTFSNKTNYERGAIARRAGQKREDSEIRVKSEVTAAKQKGKKSAREVWLRFGFGFAVRKSNFTTQHKNKIEREKANPLFLIFTLLHFLLLPLALSLVETLWNCTLVAETTPFCATWLRSLTFCSRSWDPSSNLFPPPTTLSSSSCRCVSPSFSLLRFVIVLDPLREFRVFLRKFRTLFCFLWLVMFVIFCLGSSGQENCDSYSRLSWFLCWNEWIEFKCVYRVSVFVVLRVGSL